MSDHPSNWRQAVAAHRLTLEEYLRRWHARGAFGFVGHVQTCDGDRVRISICPPDIEADAVDFVVVENHLTPQGDRG